MPRRGSHQCPNKLALTDRVLGGNNRLLRIVEPQVTNPRGINLSDIGGVRSWRSLLTVFTAVSIVSVAVFGPVQIGQLLEPRPPALQIVIIQVRLCCDGLEGAQRPGQ